MAFGYIASVSKRDNSLLPALLRRPSHKSSYGPSTDLEPVAEIPSPNKSSGRHLGSISSLVSNHSQPAVINSHSDDDDTYDLDLLGLDAPSDRIWTSVPISQVYRRKASTSSLGISEDYFSGTDPDHSPVSTSFSTDKITNYHLPYSVKHRPSRSASFSDSPSLTDTPSMTESFSSGTLSTSSINSSAPVTPHTPLTPALAEIVDAVAKISVQAQTGLSRQTSLRSINESDLALSVDSESDTNPSLSHFPIPPASIVPRKALKVKTSLSNISEVDGLRSPDWLTPSRSPGLTSGFDTPTTPSASAATSRSLSRKSSYDVLSTERRTTSATPVPQIGATISRLLYSRRSSSALDRDAAKGRLKLEGKTDEGSGSDAPSFFSEKDSSRSNILSNLWSPRSPRARTGEKRKKKEAERQKIIEITEMAKQRADSHGFEGSVGLASEKYAIAGIGGL